MSRESDILAYREKYKNLFRKYLLIYSRYGLDADDIKSEMDLALIKAYDHFDPNRGTEFGLCLSLWVKEGLMKYSVKNKKIISPNHNFALRKEKRNEIVNWSNFEFASESEAFTIKDSNTDIERSIFEKECINNLDKYLSGNQLKVIKGRLNGLSLQILADKLDLSKERIRQIEVAALNKFTNKQKFDNI